MGLTSRTYLASSTGMLTENRCKPGRALGFGGFTLVLFSFDPGLRPRENRFLLCTKREYTVQKWSANRLLIVHLRYSKISFAIPDQTASPGIKRRPDGCGVTLRMNWGSNPVVRYYRMKTKLLVLLAILAMATTGFAGGWHGGHRGGWHGGGRHFYHAGYYRYGGGWRYYGGGYAPWWVLPIPVPVPYPSYGGYGYGPGYGGYGYGYGY
jgi:hypothetical protein